MRRDGVILHRRTEFVPDLFVDCFDDFFAGEHKKTFRCSFTYAGQQNRQSAIENAKAPRLETSAGFLFWRRPIDSLVPTRSPPGGSIDSFAPAHSPAARSGVTVHLGAAPRLDSLLE